MYIMVILISISPISSNSECLFMLTYISVVKALFKSFASLSLGCLAFYIAFNNSFVFWIQVLRQVCFANTFHSVA